LFKQLATLVSDAELFENIDELEWRGPSGAFAARAARMGNGRVAARALKAAGRA